MITVKEYARQILVSALEKIKDPKRWIKGSWQKKIDEEAYGYCIQGAIRQTAYGISHTTGGTEGWMRASHVADGAIRKHLPLGHTGIATYNDDPSTTHEDIVLLLKKAIAECEE